MNPITTALPQVRQLIRQGGWFSPALVLSLLSLEFFGRQSLNDFYDTVGAAALVLLVAIVAVRHRAAPLGWVKCLGRQVWKLARYGDHFKIEFGPDLRGTPPIPSRLPWTVHLTIALLAVWSAGAVALWLYLPHSWRSYAVQGSYTLYLVGMLALWGLLFASAFGGVCFPYMLFNHLFPRATPGPAEPKMSRAQSLFLLGYLSIVVCASWLSLTRGDWLPLWIVPALCGTAFIFATALALRPNKPEVQFIWRAEGSRRVWSVSTPRLVWTTTALATLLLTAIILTAVGGRVLGRNDVDADMPITVVLGAFVAWLTPGILLSSGIFAWMLWKHNPSRPCRPSLHVGGDLAAAVRPQVTKLLHGQNWDVSFSPRPPSEIEVRVRLVEQIHSQAREFDPVWPLCVSLEDLRDPHVRERLLRRDEIQKRRLLMRGLKKIFRKAKGRHFAGGSGYWLAPHLWFMPGLARDEVDEDRDDSAAFLTQTIGPPYNQVLHRNVREYLYRFFRSLQVDLLFLEDGIDFRKLKKVLRIMFEVYDKSAGKRRAEEVQFQGLPSIKVLIHDFQIDEPFRSEMYPEPRFEDLGRARIVHVFRDRGDNEEYLEPPFDFSSSPVPLYA